MNIKVKKIIIIIFFMLLLVGALALALYLKSVSDYKTAVKNTVFYNINIADVPDGVYTGEYDVGFIYAKVNVTVSGGAITDIDITEHKNGRGAAAEKIIDKIIGEQKIDVDTISGATNSGTVIKKAVENALKSGIGA